MSSVELLLRMKLANRASGTDFCFHASGIKAKMHIGCYRSILCESNQFSPRSSPIIKRSLDEDLVLPLILAPTILFVFAPLFYFMYRSWRWERMNGLKPGQAGVKKEINGGFEKTELSGEVPGIIVHEMDSPQDAQEMPDIKNELSHELPGTFSPPQELPAALHEMPAESYDKRKRESNKMHRV
ncbi:hypothetical protein F5B17DRAFT_94216 [Nemania serpens]|nr:hypothetical protein F5B17DRAFT_94216 [Nemania serpens]